MDDIRGSLSKMKKKFKQGLAGKKRKPDGTGVDPGGERADSTISLPQSEPHVVAGGSYNQEGDRADVAGERTSSMDQPQPDEPKSVPARGSDNGHGGGEADDDGGEAGQTHLYPHPDVEVAAGSEPGGELEGINPSSSAPSISHGGKPGSTRTSLFWSLPLIVPFNNPDTSTLPDGGPEVICPDGTLEPSAAVDEKESKSKSTTSATAELLREVIDSPSGFGLLKPLAKSLCSILNNCEVRPPSCTLNSQCLRRSF